MSWEPAKEIDELTGEHTIDASPVSAVFQAVGSASTCWSDMSGTGVFDEQRAIDVANGLIEYLREHPL